MEICARSLAALAFTSLVWLLPGSAEANFIVNSSFETPEVTTGVGNPVQGRLPTTFGDWKGDDSSIVLGTQQGIDPLSGSAMLQFLFSFNSGHAEGTTGSEVHQLVDASAFAPNIAAGEALASASFYANRIAGDSQTDTSFQVRLGAYAGIPADFPTNAGNFIQREIVEIFTDSDTNTWELVSVGMVLPTGTDYLAITILSHENIFNDTSGTEFDGHYADNASLTIIPEPSTGLLVAAGLLALASYRRGRVARK